MSITDNDECVMGTDTCDQVCINKPGSYNCSCNTGFSLKANGISCIGNNEIRNSVKIIILQIIMSVRLILIFVIKVV